MRLSRVVDDAEVVFFCERLNGVDIDGISIEMDGRDRRCTTGDSTGRIINVDIECVWINFAEDGSCAASDDHGRGGDKGETGAQDFVAGLNEGLIGELEGGGSI